MVKFSAAEEKNASRKRRCLPCPCASDDSGEEDEESGVEIRRKEDSSGDGNDASNGGKESAYVIMDPDTLECPICYETMNPPILQCQNGHIACSHCSKKMNKCHSCSLPLGPTRCLPLEKIIESIKLPCPNYHLGCTEFLLNSERESHSVKCTKIPCYCPLPNCLFSGSGLLLSLHLVREHHPVVADSCLTYDVPLTVSIEGGGPRPAILVFIGSDNSLFFLLFNSSGQLFMACIGPDSLVGRFSYRLKASCKGSSVLFESGVLVIRRLEETFSPDFFLFVPPGFISDRGRIVLDICILSNP